MAKTDLDFIGSTVKFIGGQASFTGDVISISEGEKAKKEAEFTTEAEKGGEFSCFLLFLFR